MTNQSMKYKKNRDKPNQLRASEKAMTRGVDDCELKRVVVSVLHMLLLQSQDYGI